MSPAIDDDVVLVDIRPVIKSTGAPLEDDDIIMVDSFAFEQKRKPASKASRRARTTTTRTCPYNRSTRPSRPASRKRLGKWDTFSEEWSQIDEAFQDRPDLRAQLAGVRGYVEILEQDQDLHLWKDPLLEQWKLLEGAVESEDERSIIDWVGGMLMDVFDS